jgi:hypothetical protein
MLTMTSPLTKATHNGIGRSERVASTMWYVIYAKVIDDKDSGIKVTEAHFGGVDADEEGAVQIARECVNAIKGGTPIVKLFRADGYRLRAVMNEATAKFKKIEERMLTTAEIISRGTKPQR